MLSSSGIPDCTRVRDSLASDVEIGLAAEVEIAREHQLERDRIGSRRDRKPDAGLDTPRLSGLSGARFETVRTGRAATRRPGR